MKVPMTDREPTSPPSHAAELLGRLLAASVQAWDDYVEGTSSS